MPTQPKTEIFSEMTNRILRPSMSRPERVLDLFAGCGGLALGFEAIGFETLGFEMNPDCCATYNANLQGHCTEQFLTAETVFPEAEVIIGGPPCQPFSVGGHQLGLEDARDGFPSFISAVEQLHPRLWMFENVRGLLYKNRWYLDEIVQRLERLGYVVDVRLLNAAHYLVPQNRERIIVVGHKGGYTFPERTSETVTVAQALGGFLFAEPEEGRYLTESMDRYVAKYEKASKCINPRDLDPNKPSRTVTCRNLGGATGDMQRIKLPSGRRRRLTVREGARLQSFPDWYEFSGSEGSQFDQVGNAVAPMFAYALAQSVVSYLDSETKMDDESIRQSWSPVHLDEQVSSGSYDDIRRKDLLLPVEAGIVLKSAGNERAATNDGTRTYALSIEMADLLHTYGMAQWSSKLVEFLSGHDTLAQQLMKARSQMLLPVTVGTQQLYFSSGEHNLLQKHIIEDFLPRFGHSAQVLYVGDTQDKLLFVEESQLLDIGFSSSRMTNCQMFWPTQKKRTGSFSLKRSTPQILLQSCVSGRSSD